MLHHRNSSEGLLVSDSNVHNDDCFVSMRSLAKKFQLRRAAISRVVQEDLTCTSFVMKIGQVFFQGQYSREIWTMSIAHFY